MDVFRVCLSCASRRWMSRCSRQSVRNSFQLLRPSLQKNTGFPRLLCTSSSQNPDSTFSGRKTTVDEDEVMRLSRSGMDWWDPCGEFIALHTMNKLRVPYVKNAILGDQDDITNPSSPLRGFNILDVGCGGGLLSEPLARLGANVKGIDASARNIHVALRHASQDPSFRDELNYKCITVEELAEDEGEAYDCVVSSEVIEHVTEKESFIEAISQLLKPGGSLVLTTMSRTPQAYILAIVGAEYIARVVPAGTHDWNKFPTIDELIELLREYDLETEHIQGMVYNPVTHQWSKCDNTDVNFALHAVKIRPEESPV